MLRAYLGIQRELEIGEACLFFLQTTSYRLSRGVYNDITSETPILVMMILGYQVLLGRRAIDLFPKYTLILEKP